MFQIFKKISKEEILDSLENKDIDPILKFIKQNRKTFQSNEKNRGPTKEEALFQNINVQIVYFSITKFKTYINTLIKYNIDPRSIVIGNMFKVNFFHRCIARRKAAYAAYLLETKLFHLDPKDFTIWHQFIHGYPDSKKEPFFEIFHFIMKNGGNLNEIFHGKTVLEHILTHAPISLVDEIKPYLNSLTEENLEIYKQQRLQHLFLKKKG